MDAKAYTRPQVTPEEAMRAVVDRFSLPVTQVKELPSEPGLRFLLQEEALGRNYILDVSPAEEDPEILDFKNRMLEHLDRAGFSLPKALYAFDGNEVVELPGPEGQSYLTRLLTWVPGAVLADVASQTPGLFRSLGTFLGKLDSALEDFSHPAQDRELKWDLKGAGRVVRSNLEFVEDEGRRELLEEMSQRFLEQLGPLVPDLRMSVINAGTNDLNVLVEELGEAVDPGNRQVIGVADFGDAVRSYTAGEVAIGAAYAMLGKADPLIAAAHVVEGYHEAYPLNDAEIAALYPLMGLRLCACLAIAAHQKTLEQDSESLAIDEAAAWALLVKLEGESVTFPHFLFRQACGLDPLPNSGAVVGWLKEHGEEAAPVVGDEALSAVPLHVLDFSIGSGEFGLTPEPDDAVGWTDLIFQKKMAVGAEVGVGRYDEVRRWYTSDIFRTPTDGAPEWRTVHIGIDLFLDAGSPVSAPFDAVVHSVANNEGDLDYGPTVILEHRVTDGPSDNGKAPEAEADSGGGDPGGTLRFWTLYGHLGDGVLSDLTPGQTIAKGEAFAEIGNIPLNGNWAPHLHFQIMTDTLEKEGDFPGVARPSQRALWKALSPDPNLILGIPDPGERAAKGGRELMNPERAGPAEVGKPSGVPLRANSGHTEEENLKLRSEYLGPNLGIAYKRPLKIVRGVGQYLYDGEGQAYLDCVNNVSNVGHNHPSVVAAGRRQMAILNTNTRYLHDLLVEYAEELVALLPGELSKVYFVNSGSEANELALRMARAHTKRRDVVVVEGAYHGDTSTMVELSPCKFDGPGGDGALDWVHKVPVPDPYRGTIRALPEGGASEEPGFLPADEVGPAYAEQFLQVLNQMGAGGRDPSAFFCEPILGSGGQIVLPEGFMAAAFGFAREAGAVCIADEVQVGFGRAGTHFWAFETQGAEPDILTLGKPMGNGHPLGAVITTPEIAESFNNGMEYSNTFGGNPVSCAIGLAVLDVIREEGLQENARVVGEHLLAGLRELQAKYPLIGDVRGLGLNIGVEMVKSPESREPAAEEADRVKERLREHHLLLSTDVSNGNVLKTKPPIVFTTENADHLVETLDKILSEEEFQK